MTAKEVIDLAKKEVGVHESPANSNNVKYNTWYYGHEVSGAQYPWCCTFISWLFKGTGLVKKTASCVDLYNYFKATNRLVKVPQTGDIVFFRFNTNNRFTNHVGLVVSVSSDGKTITSIEGNTSITSSDNGGMVMQRYRKGNIVGYARPKYSDASAITKPVTSNNDDLEKVARDVIKGKYGNGTERKARLEALGYDYYKVQAKVKEIMNNGK